MRLIAIGTVVILAMIGCTTSAGGEEELVGRVWTLESIEGFTSFPSDVATPTIRFAPDGLLSGNTGCNGFSGPYELRGDSILFGTLVSTRRACVDEGMNRQEAAYLGMLSEARTWRLAGDTLLIEGGRGAARFLPGR